MQRGVGLLLAEAADFLPVEHRLERHDAPLDVAAHGRLLHDLHRLQAAGGHRVEIVGIAEVSGRHARRGQRIGAGELDGAARPRADLPQVDGAAVAAGHAVDALLDPRAHHHEVLDVGARLVGLPPPEGATLDQVGGGRAAAEQRVLQPGQRPPAQPLVLVVAVRALQLVHQRDLDVILQVAANAGQVGQDRDAVPLERLRRADARQHQQLRRIERASADDHLAPRAQLAFPPVLDEPDAHRAALLDDDPRDAHAGAHAQVAAMPGRPQVGAGRAAAPAVARGDLVEPAAGRVARVEVFVVGQPRLLAGPQPRLAERVDVADVGYAERAAGAVLRVAEALVVLGAQEIRQHVGMGPAGRAGLAPAIVVGRHAADVDHRVDRAAAAEHARLHHGRRFLAMLLVRRDPGNALEQRALRGLVIGPRNVDVRAAIGRALLEQGHAHALVLAQPRGDHAARRAAAHDDVVDHLIFVSCGLSPSRPGPDGGWISAIRAWPRRPGGPARHPRPRAASRW